ncbi:ABC transporter permease [Roseateles sp. DAIF2]|uniref:ABC transporter permease n=1 Tax=Roseateles sp. DAIF2 TaxID=2714952 RepID=UPI0018A32327|nr:ABC transporter permease [Roseateles sp. DAIF2]QPF71654.1 ABC transporter permease [Roseateles sp. DAIF2]
MLRTWLAEVLRTWRSVLGDAGVLLMLAIAPLLYSFFYPWPYSTEQLQRVPVALVDQDHSALSRQIQRFTQASPRLELRLLTADEGEARAALAAGEIRAYALLPAGLKREAGRGRGQVVPVLADGAYFLPNKIALLGFAEVIGTVSAGIELRQLQAHGQSPQQAAAGRNPLNLQLGALYNPHEGYGSAVVPAVAVLIVQQLLLIGVAMWVGQRFEITGPARPAEGAAVWSARIAAFAAFGLASGAWFFVLIFPFFGYAHGGNQAGAALLLLPFAWAVAAAGVALGALLAERERAMQLLLASSLPIAFLAGFSWPREALPAPLWWLGELFIPAVPGIQAFLRLNQMGAPLQAVQAEALALTLQALAYSALAAWALRRRR